MEGFLFKSVEGFMPFWDIVKNVYGNLSTCYSPKVFLDFVLKFAINNMENSA